jgi:hypothetical protein
MTTRLKRLLISGFRGIPGQLPLDFAQGGNAKSMILYGGNGTGKSSISDSWEWLTTGRIEHLAREGAKESSYPNMGASPGGVYVEAEFSDPSLGTVRLDFDHNRITKPIASGALDAVRLMIKHACHIRYGDLTDFVFLTKSERYDALARLMGFVPQMEYQKSLRRVEGLFEKDVDRLALLRDAAEERIEKHFAKQAVDLSPIEQLSRVATLKDQGEVKSLEDVDSLVQTLNQEVEKDPRAVKLASHKILQSALASAKPPNLSTDLLSTLSSAIGHLASMQKDTTVTQLRIPFLQSSEKLLEATGEAGICPLCGKGFEGDLREHVATELGKLKHLKGVLDGIRDAKLNVLTPLAGRAALLSAFDDATEGTELDVGENALSNYRTESGVVDAVMKRIEGLMAFDTSGVPDTLISSLAAEEVSLKSALKEFGEAKKKLLQQSEDRALALETDPERVRLVETASFVREGVKALREHKEARTRWATADTVLDSYRTVVSRFVSDCLVDVQKRFDLISGQVKTCFEMLEKNTPGLGEPRLKLLPDQDRSVVLEIFFRGEDVHPAYKYLSESQLNSFGLAVFLASATHFNQECRLLILDDVVNSFDAYKRPLLIELIKNHFADRQILLMTHDRFWRDNLVRFLPKWRRVEFVNYQPNLGPTIRPGLSRLDQVKADLSNDRADSASRELYAHVDNVIQDVCEEFEVELKFNRRNDYTLDTFLDRLKVRLESKLGLGHQLTKDTHTLFKANAYRNWVSHCKTPVAPIHADEVREVLEVWERIETAVMCHEANCEELLGWDKGSKSFVCPCGATRLIKDVPKESES